MKKTNSPFCQGALGVRAKRVNNSRVHISRSVILGAFLRQRVLATEKLLPFRQTRSRSALRMPGLSGPPIPCTRTADLAVASSSNRMAHPVTSTVFAHSIALGKAPAGTLSAKQFREVHTCHRQGQVAVGAFLHAIWTLAGFDVPIVVLEQQVRRHNVSGHTTTFPVDLPACRESFLARGTHHVAV
jgi:hypothetical protein